MISEVRKLFYIAAAAVVLVSCAINTPPERKKPLENMEAYGLDQTINIQASILQSEAAKKKGIDLPVGNYLPSKKVAPIYPLRARTRGITGWALIAYTVTETGEIEDIRVVDEYPKEIFSEASIAATKQFTFEPLIHNGVPVRIPNAWNIFTYTVEW